MFNVDAGLVIRIVVSSAVVVSNNFISAIPVFLTQFNTSYISLLVSLSLSSQVFPVISTTLTLPNAIFVGNGELIRFAENIPDPNATQFPVKTQLFFKHQSPRETELHAKRRLAD